MKRSKWKGLYTNIRLKILKKNNSNILPISRNSAITPNFIGLTFKIHTGKIFKEITIIEEMVSNKFGEFAKTRHDFVFKKKKKKKK
jgi:small subunit ribosomal protein S19